MDALGLLRVFRELSFPNVCLPRVGCEMPEQGRWRLVGLLKKSFLGVFRVFSEFVGDRGIGALRSFYVVLQGKDYEAVCWQS